MGRSQTIDSDINENDIIAALGACTVERLREIYAVCRDMLLGTTKEELAESALWYANDMRESKDWKVVQAVSMPALITYQVVAWVRGDKIAAGSSIMGCPADGDTAFDMYRISDQRDADSWLVSLLPSLG